MLGRVGASLHLSLIHPLSFSLSSKCIFCTCVYYGPNAEHDSRHSIHSSWLIHVFCMGCLDPHKKAGPSRDISKVHTKFHFYGTVATTLEYFRWKDGNGNLRSVGKVDRRRARQMYFICLGSLIYFPARIQSPTRQHQWRTQLRPFQYILHEEYRLRLTSSASEGYKPILHTSAPASWFSSPASLRRTWSIPTIRTTLPTRI